MSSRPCILALLCALGCGRGTLDLKPDEKSVEPGESATSTSTAVTPTPATSPSAPTQYPPGSEPSDRPNISDPTAPPPLPDPPDAGMQGPSVAPADTNFGPGPSDFMDTRPPDCSRPTDCPEELPFCLSFGVCGECLSHPDCADKPDGRTWCDWRDGRCVQCAGPENCAQGERCTFKRTCVEGCDNNDDCFPDRECEIQSGECVQCVRGFHCYQILGASMGACDPVSNECRPCIEDFECGHDGRCDDGTCVFAGPSGEPYVPADFGGDPSMPSAPAPDGFAGAPDAGGTDGAGGSGGPRH